MHLQRTLPHYAKALLSKKTGRTIYHIVSISPSIVINGQETIKGRRKETSGLLSLFNKAYALLPQVLNIRPISCCFVSKMSKIFLSPMSSHMLGLCVSRLSDVVKKFSKNQLQSLPSPPPLIHAAPTSVARFEFIRLTPKTDLSLEA